MGALGQGCIVTSLPPLSDGTLEPKLLPNQPNPFNSVTQLSFYLPTPERVTLQIFASSGREVVTLLEAVPIAAGLQSLIWDGKDGAGSNLPSGIYLTRMQTPSHILAGKLTLIK